MKPLVPLDEVRGDTGTGTGTGDDTPLGTRKRQAHDMSAWAQADPPSTNRRGCAYVVKGLASIAGPPTGVGALVGAAVAAW